MDERLSDKKRKPYSFRYGSGEDSRLIIKQADGDDDKLVMDFSQTVMDSSDSDNSFRENEDPSEDDKLINDSALYLKKKSKKIPQILQFDDLHVLDGLEEIREKSGENTPNPTPRGSKKLNTSGKHLTTYDIDTRAEPNMTQPKPEIMRMNSFSHLDDSKREEKKQQEEDKLSLKSILTSSPTKKKHASDQKLFNPTKRESKIYYFLKRKVIFQKIISFAYDEVSKWEKVCTYESISIKKIKPEHSPVVLIRAWAHIKNFTPEEVFKQIHDTEQRKSWDTVTTNLKVLEKIDEKTEVIYFLVKVTRFFRMTNTLGSVRSFE